jgi:hypothetical protein
MMFHVGQKVVRVAAINTSDPMMFYYYEQVPTKGEIYTVREVFMDRFMYDTEDRQALLLVEIVNRPRMWATHGFHEAGFQAEKFRPLVARTTDISVFEKLLTPRRVEEPV